MITVEKSNCQFIVGALSLLLWPLINMLPVYCIPSILESCL